CVYEGTLLPDKYRGQLLHSDAGPRHVRCYHMQPKGAAWAVSREDVVKSTDNWFRPSDVCVAPDGSIFIADWYDPGVGGHGMGDWTRGRIYRLTPKGHQGYKVPELKLEDNPGVLTALASPNLATRALASAVLRTKQHDLQPALKSGNPLLRARAWWEVLRFEIPRMHLNPDPTEG